MCSRDADRVGEQLRSHEQTLSINRPLVVITGECFSTSDGTPFKSKFLSKQLNAAFQKTIIGSLTEGVPSNEHSSRAIGPYWLKNCNLSGNIF
nr:hypothetical transcript [Hymenolepis microstoma]